MQKYFRKVNVNKLGILAQIPWSHNIILMEKLDSVEQRLWYASKTIENGWGKRALEDWIEKDIYSRQGKAITNFSLRLPEPQSTLAKETLCDPYFFDFLSLPFFFSILTSRRTCWYIPFSKDHEHLHQKSKENNR